MRFPFNERKTAQAAAYLLSRHRGILHYMHLVKLLYYADRQAIVETGRPITGDQMVSMDKGPVLSDILNFIREKKPAGPDWREYISRRRPDFTVAGMKVKPESDQLSEYELSVLTEIDERHGLKDRFLFSAESHRLPEWKDPDGTSIPIEITDILRYENNSEKEVADVEDASNVDWFFNKLEDDPK
jgi:hypothetical protein